MGAQSSDPALPNYANGHLLPGTGMSPVHEVRLQPFFVSKYELTQAQWQRQTGRSESQYPAGSRYATSSLHPAEGVTQERMLVVARELGVELPSEAQWEHAARAGTATAWSFGGQSSTLARYGNVADQAVIRTGQSLGWRVDEAIDDGFVAHAPIGSFAPNPWGLHDVHGNVAEWPRSTFEDWADHPPQDGAGDAVGEYQSIVYRGGSFNRDSIQARSSRRDGLPPNVKSSSIGIRPILPHRSR